MSKVDVCRRLQFMRFEQVARHVEDLHVCRCWFCKRYGEFVVGVAEVQHVMQHELDVCALLA